MDACGEAPPAPSCVSQHRQSLASLSRGVGVRSVATYTCAWCPGVRGRVSLSGFKFGRAPRGALRFSGGYAFASPSGAELARAPTLPETRWSPVVGSQCGLLRKSPSELDTRSADAGQIWTEFGQMGAELGPTSLKFGPAMANFGVDSAKFGRVRPNMVGLCQFGVDFDQLWPISTTSGVMSAKYGRRCPVLGRLRRTSADSTNFGSTSTKLGRCPSTWAKFGPSSPKFGRHW